MHKLIVSIVISVFFAMHALACGEKSVGTQGVNATQVVTESHKCPSMQKVCPGQASKAHTQAILASNTKVGNNNLCNSTRIAISMALGLGLILGASLIGNKAKV